METTTTKTWDDVLRDRVYEAVRRLKEATGYIDTQLWHCPGHYGNFWHMIDQVEAIADKLMEIADIESTCYGRACRDGEWVEDPSELVRFDDLSAKLAE